MTFNFTSASLLGLLFAITSVAADDKPEKGYEFKIEQIKPQPAMTIRFRVADSSEISAKYGEAFGQLVGHIASEGGQIAGAPFGRYHSFTKDGIEIEAGIPVAKIVEEKGNIKPTELPGGNAITTIHMGGYKELGNAHNAMQRWVKEQGHKTTGGPWEYYLTDPGQEPDSSKWRTKLIQLIANKGKGQAE